MDTIIRSGQEYFWNSNLRRKEPHITIGICTFLVSFMAAMHVTFGVLLTSQNIVGHPLRCHGANTVEEDICASNSHYQRLGQAIQGEKTYAFHRITQWIFILIGITFITASYLWKRLEKGVVLKLCGDFLEVCKSNEDSEKQASVIACHLAVFDEWHWSYLYRYIVSELVNVSLFSATVVYYFWLMNIHKYGFHSILLNYVQPNLDDDSRMFDLDYMYYLFPREIGCAYQHFSPSGIKQVTRLRCKVTNQEFNELFHIIAATLSFLCLVLYILNFCYITVKLLFAKNPYLKNHKGQLTIRKKFILLLLSSNLDGVIVHSISSKLDQLHSDLNKV